MDEGEVAAHPQGQHFPHLHVIRLGDVNAAIYRIAGTEPGAGLERGYRIEHADFGDVVSMVW